MKDAHGVRYLRVLWMYLMCYVLEGGRIVFKGCAYSEDEVMNKMIVEARCE